MIFKLPYSRENEDLLRACVSKRLSPAILDKTIKNSNSQKVESFNRVLRRSLPRNVTFTRSFSGRAHSAAHSSNHGPGNSVRSLCAGVGAAIPSGARSTTLFTSFGTPIKWTENISNHNPFKKKRVIKRKKLHELYKIHQDEIQCKKNVSFKECRDRGKKTEHNYSKT